jgi:hypothetical protein
MQMERRARARLDGADKQRGILADLDRDVDESLRQSGVAAALDLAEALLARLQAFEALMRLGRDEHRAHAQQCYGEAEGARTALLNIGQQLNELQSAAERDGLFSRLLARGFPNSIGSDQKRSGSFEPFADG